MKKVVRAVSLMLLMAGVCGNAFAEENENIVRQGAIRGRVIDNGKQILPGASIFVENLKTGVISDVNGFYTLPNLKPGTYTVKVTYVGYSPIEMKVTVPEGKTLEKDIVMNEGVELQEVQVKGAFQGQKKAINTQKNNLGITNVVSADQVGKFPDSNIGDALKRISGINVQYDQGEARFGQVRGTSADLSSVTINGNRVPSAEGDTRNVQLDLIPADMIQTIEVSKVVTPDMDGDAIGGSINLVTKNSPYKRTINATAGSGYNWISEKAQLNLGFTYGDRFFNDRLGMLLSASYQNAPSGSYDTEFMWEQNEDGKVYVSDYQMRQYFVTRERQSYSAAFDFDINENHKLTFKGIFNNRNDWENRYRTNIKDLDENGKGTVRIQTKAGTPDNRNARLERQRTMDFALGGEHLWGAIGMDWNASYAKATEERPNERYLDFQLKKQEFDMDLSDERQPLATPGTGSTLTLSDKFSLKELTEQQEDIKEEDMKFSANFKASLNNGAKLKFGAKVVRKTKEKEIDFYEYTPKDEDAFMTNSLKNTVDQSTDKFMPSDKYQVGTFASKEEWVPELQGLSLRNVNVTILDGKKKLYDDFGEMLFTHYGVSGPLILSASSYVGKKLKAKELTLKIDLKPALSEEQLDHRVLREFEENQNRQFKNAVHKLFPSKLIPVMIELSGIDPEKKVNVITKEERLGFVRLIKGLTCTLTDLRDYNEAIITKGGIKIKEVDPGTMESKLVKGLHFAGEVLDLDAVTGGFNLQIAWSTAYAAGTGIQI